MEKRSAGVKANPSGAAFAEPDFALAAGMAKDDRARDDRLAQALRENLKRRKAQARRSPANAPARPDADEATDER